MNATKTFAFRCFLFFINIVFKIADLPLIELIVNHSFSSQTRFSPSELAAPCSFSIRSRNPGSRNGCGICEKSNSVVNKSSLATFCPVDVAIAVVDAVVGVEVESIWMSAGRRDGYRQRAADGFSRATVFPLNGIFFFPSTPLLLLFSMISGLFTSLHFIVSSKESCQSCD